MADQISKTLYMPKDEAKKMKKEADSSGFKAMPYYLAALTIGRKILADKVSRGEIPEELRGQQNMGGAKR